MGPARDFTRPARQPAAKPTSTPHGQRYRTSRAAFSRAASNPGGTLGRTGACDPKPNSKPVAEPTAARVTTPQHAPTPPHNRPLRKTRTVLSPSEARLGVVQVLCRDARAGTVIGVFGRDQANRKQSSVLTGVRSSLLCNSGDVEP